MSEQPEQLKKKGGRGRIAALRAERAKAEMEAQEEAQREREEKGEGLGTLDGPRIAEGDTAAAVRVKRDVERSKKLLPAHLKQRSRAKPGSYPLKTDPAYRDRLVETPAPPQQQYFVASFLAQPDVIKRREMFFFERFVQQWDLSSSLDRFTEFLFFMSKKHGIPMADLEKDLTEYVTEESSRLVAAGRVHDDYVTFIEKYGEELVEEFHAAYPFETGLRMIKVAGAFGSHEAAHEYGKFVRTADAGSSTHVGAVGLWMPFDADFIKDEKKEYLEEEGNELMAQRDRNNAACQREFTQRKQQAEQQAFEDNVAQAQADGTKLSQFYDYEQKKLVKTRAPFSVDQLASAADLAIPDNEDSSLEDIKRSLFNDPTVITTTTDHGKSLLSPDNPFM